VSEAVLETIKEDQVVSGDLDTLRSFFDGPDFVFEILNQMFRVTFSNILGKVKFLKKSKKVLVQRRVINLLDPQNKISQTLADFLQFLTFFKLGSQLVDR